MTCRTCEWLHTWLGAKSEIDCDRIWNHIHDWETAHSNASALWAEDLDANRELIEQATAIRGTDPGSAFQMYLEAADAGSPWALKTVGWHYHWGSFVKADHELALDYYHRAICAGSWMATIPYARLLAEHGHWEACERVLQDGIRSDFLPAYFWLAKLRLKQSRSRKTCGVIRPLLEHASDKGHPGARRLLAALLLLGKYGFRQIPIGFRIMRECIQEDLEKGDGAEESMGETAAGDRVCKPADTADPGLARPAARTSSASP